MVSDLREKLARSKEKYKILKSAREDSQAVRLSDEYPKSLMSNSPDVTGFYRPSESAFANDKAMG